VGDLVRLLGLPRDLRFADHHRVECRGDSKEVPYRRRPEMNVEAVVFRQLALTVGEIGETAAKVEEQGIGVDPRLPAEVELDPVAGPEVDELGETRKTGELDQVLAWKVGRQSGRRELVDTNPVPPGRILRHNAAQFSHREVKLASTGLSGLRNAFPRGCFSGFFSPKQ